MSDEGVVENIWWNILGGQVLVFTISSSHGTLKKFKRSQGYLWDRLDVIGCVLLREHRFRGFPMTHNFFKMINTDTRPECNGQ